MPLACQLKCPLTLLSISLIFFFPIMGQKRKRSQSLTMASKATPKASQLADPALLDKIDRSFQCNVGQYVPLPQLVVVGDQSSGKSSVLEGLTRLPFPRDKALCTRFATQITFRRAQHESINVSAIPSKDATTDHATKLNDWKHEGVKDLNAVEFASIIHQACFIKSLEQVSR